MADELAKEKLAPKEEDVLPLLPKEEAPPVEEDIPQAKTDISLANEEVYEGLSYPKEEVKTEILQDVPSTKEAVLSAEDGIPSTKVDLKEHTPIAKEEPNLNDSTTQEDVPSVQEVIPSKSEELKADVASDPEEDDLSDLDG